MERYKSDFLPIFERIESCLTDLDELDWRSLCGDRYADWFEHYFIMCVSSVYKSLTEPVEL